MAAIHVDKVSKAYRDNKILNRAELIVEHGKTYGLVGLNGSGKSVLLQMIAGLIRPDEGQVTVDGKRVGVDVEFPPNMGMLINGPTFIPHYSGMANLRLLAAYKGIADKEKIAGTMKLVGLDPSNRKAVSKYSSGMKARLGIAQAIMETPELLILDEPFNGLDKAGLQEMHRLVMDMKAEGKTILLSSHSQFDIDTLCDHVYEIADGKAAYIR